MIYEVDLLNEVVLLIDGDFNVVDAFPADGLTQRTCALPVEWYTYRSLVTPPGICALCGVGPDSIDQHCVSSGGFHAFTSSPNLEIPREHKAENRNLPLRTLAFEDLQFYLEADNLFPVQDIQKTMVV